MDDLISRQAAIDVIEKWLECSDYNEAERHIMRATESILYDLPSVNQQEPCDDAVSRQAVLDAFAGYVGSGMSMNDFDALWDIVVKAPSVNPQPTAHWICGLSWKCSKCGYEDDRALGTDFCPHCGRRMDEAQKRSE